MSDICIRPMQAEDIDAVLTIEHQSFSLPWSREAFQAEVCNNLACYLVMEMDGLMIGYGGMWIVLDEAHITNVAILPDYREQGLGKRLFASMIHQANSRGTIRMTLEVRVSNTAAQKLYKGFGFTVCGLRRGYYTDNQEDALIMWRQ
ncbi:Ribosomal-protein-alanine acetyltransferase [bioreactor metagenome]|uniref:Ribosomal-protein-alanine acetyltransferase n=1 Tax=bioreactor metagenome TaxID=1076179 RepID=A0A644TJ03_9ZZZZ|nr:ribosomal protein S18-alanine N-acetyltransferase [Negativicutes bacterium]